MRRKKFLNFLYIDFFLASKSVPTGISGSIVKIVESYPFCNRGFAKTKSMVTLEIITSGGYLYFCTVLQKKDYSR